VHCYFTNSGTAPAYNLQVYFKTRKCETPLILPVNAKTVYSFMMNEVVSGDFRCEYNTLQGHQICDIFEFKVRRDVASICPSIILREKFYTVGSTPPFEIKRLDDGISSPSEDKAINS
jgi:hypothetical protein